MREFKNVANDEIVLNALEGWDEMSEEEILAEEDGVWDEIVSDYAVALNITLEEAEKVAGEKVMEAVNEAVGEYLSDTEAVSGKAKDVLDIIVGHYNVDFIEAFELLEYMVTGPFDDWMRLRDLIEDGLSVDWEVADDLILDIGWEFGFDGYTEHVVLTSDLTEAVMEENGVDRAGAELILEECVRAVNGLFDEEYGPDDEYFDEEVEDYEGVYNGD